MTWPSLALALAALVAPSQAALRFGCSTLSIQRLDPLVQPGALPSAHLHQIVGGNGFNATMSPTDDPAARATCTTCTFSEDFSNYWTAVMFFKHPNGSFKRVPIMQNTALPNGINGGMTVYYTQKDFGSNGNKKITAFPKGFRMTVGNSAATTQQGKGLKFVCLADKGTRFPELNDFPTTKCKAGIMTVHHFPSCWDGKNIDSPDHQSHMYNTVGDAFNEAGACPTSHPVRVPQVAYETLWDTTGFDSLWTPGNGTQPFVLSNQDARGYGTHADYLFGWKDDSLQKAMDSTCMFNACEGGRPLKSQGVAQMNACTVKSSVNENIDGWLSALPLTGNGQAPPVGTNPPPQTPTQPPAVTPSNPPVTPSQPPVSGTVPKYGQCGGQGYNGPTQCVAGTTCQVSNQYYSQCL